MYNLSFQTKTFPTSWKIANIMPLKKTGDPSDVNNLRPISLLPLPGIFLERIVHSQISNILETNKLFCDKQRGFRKGKSTISTVVDYTDNILTGLKDKEYTIAAYIDFKKAFDTVNHTILFKKNSHFGLSQGIADWIGSYISNRMQCCTVNGLTSSILPIKCGVLQGSILDPMFFLLYINDLSDKLEHTNVTYMPTVLLSI